MDTLAVIILSGGFSSRMGMDKGLIPFRGRPMIQRILDIASELTGEILIIANKKGYEQFGHPVHQDILKGKGPLGGIHTGLTHSNANHNLVLACDMPMMTLEFVKYLMDEVSEEDQIVVPRHRGKMEPLCAMYSKVCLSSIENAAKSSDLSLHNFINTNKVKFIDLYRNSPYYSPYLFSNANTMEELKELESVEL